MMENNGMYMPVAPAGNYGNYGNDNMFGGSWMWFLLVWMAMFGWGNNGFGGNRGEVQQGFDQAALTNGINNIQNSLCNGFAGVSNGFAQAEISANARQMADMNQNFALQNLMSANGCETRAAIQDLKYTIATEACNTRAANAAGMQAIQDKLCQLEMDGIKQNYEGQLRELQDKLNAERDSNQALRFAASQGAQTAAIIANNEAQTTALEQYLNPPARPAWIVQNPNCCNGNTCSTCGGM